jgi:hypothetical protein
MLMRMARTGCGSHGPAPAAPHPQCAFYLIKECADSLWILGLHSDVCHDGQVRTAACPVQEAVHAPGRPFEDGPGPAVGKVAYPPAHTVVKGHPLAGAAEVDALNLAGDQHPIADHNQKVRRDRQRCGRVGCCAARGLGSILVGGARNCGVMAGRAGGCRCCQRPGPLGGPGSARAS